MKNSIKEDIIILVAFNLAPSIKHISEIEFKDVQKAIEHILQDYKKLQEEFKQVDHECERLEEKEARLIKENEYYKDLINALETYYNITREDLEKCMKNDR